MHAGGMEVAWAVLVLLLAAAGVAWASGLRGSAVAAAAAAACLPGPMLIGRPSTIAAAALLLGALWLPIVLFGAVTVLGRQRRFGHAIHIVLGALALAEIGRLLFDEPFLDPACHLLCLHSPVLLTVDRDLAGRLATIAVVLAVIGALMVLGMALAAAVSSPRVTRLRPLGVAMTAALAGASAAARFSDGAFAERTPSASRALRLSCAFAVVALVLGAAAERAATWRRVRRVGRLLAENTGAHTTAPLTPGTVDADLDAVAAAGARLGTSARIALQNESLRRQLELRIAELSTSRRRVVDVGDEARATIERDLHDGAQQRALALSFELRRGQKRAEAIGDRDAAALFGSALGAATGLLEQLRTIAHGIHPAELDNAGLAAALRQLAESTTRSFEVDVDGVGGLPQHVQRTAYAVVRDGAARGLDKVVVRGADDGLHLRVESDGEPSATILDRVLAIDGRLRNDRGRWEVVLPCA